MKTKLSLDNIDFRKGTQEYIKSLDSLRLKSIENCNQYTIEQLNVWKNSQFDWINMIDKTTICYYEKEMVGFVSIKENEYILYM